MGYPWGSRDKNSETQQRTGTNGQGQSSLFHSEPGSAGGIGSEATDVFPDKHNDASILQLQGCNYRRRQNSFVFLS